MADEKTKVEQGSTAVAEPPAKPAPKSAEKPKPKLPGFLPPYRVLLHNDDENTAQHVVESIVELTPLNEQAATVCMKEADQTGVALVLVTHKERAELYRDQFTSKGLTVTIEPAE